MYFAAATAGGAVLGYFLASLAFGEGIGAVIAISILAIGLVTIYTKQKEGLHKKKRFTGIVVYSNLFKTHL